MPGIFRTASKAILVIPTLFFCCQKESGPEATVYYNEFDSGSLDNIESGELLDYYGNTVLGNYHRGGFTLKLNELPAHEYLVVSFDLLVHDSWDGNFVSPIGPDVWNLEVDGKQIINTSFSNSICNSSWCAQQSYPNNQKYMHNPKTGAFQSDLPSVCFSGNLSFGSSLYRISRIVKHSSPNVSIHVFDELTQPLENDKCDESWSVDNLLVSVFSMT